ncbi:MAG: NYN domain-containing protein [Acidimicrobiales bacterium]
MNATPTTSLRAALQLALAVARRGEQEWPAVPAPARLRPYLGFAKAPNAALELCRRVVDDDEAFRRRVAAEATVDQVGSVGWLWLTRPENWEAGIAELQAQAERARAEHGTARHRDELARRQAAVRETLEQANQARRQLAAELDGLRSEQADQQRQLREQRAAREAAEAELARVEAERVALLRRLKAAEALVARHGADLRALQADHDALRRVHASLAEELAEVRSIDQRGDRPSDQPSDQPTDQPTDQPLDRSLDPALERPEAPGPAGALVPPGLRAAIDAASQAAAALSDALGAAAAALDGPDGGHAGPPTGPEPTGRWAAPTATPPGLAVGPGRQPTRPAGGPGTPSCAGRCACRRAPSRTPPRPPSTWCASPGAVPRRRLQRGQGGLARARAPPPAHRLVEALVALQARTGAQTDVVFDGVDDAGLRRVGPGRLRVEFTPSHLEADDRLLELVELTPAARPVVVVSSDRRVRDGARRRRANTLRSEQLLWLLR